MSNHLARDQNLWNTMHHAEPRPVGGEGYESDSSSVDSFNEKRDDFDLEKGRTRKPRLTARKVHRWVALLLLMLFVGYQIIQQSNCAFEASLVGGTSGNEGFSVEYPYVGSHYGKPVWSSKVLEHTFDIWGHPYGIKWTPPDVEFNRVVVTLHTEVDFVQYDRLAHLYVGGAEVWRTLTIEPSGQLRFSDHRKDVSVYSSLFKESGEILFQLDNIVTDKLKGVFNVTLTVELFQVDDKPDFFDAKVASKVFPLVDKKVPLVSLPNDQFKVILPQISKNTTRLQLSVFTSGNGHEEFWYTNVVDLLASKFGGEVEAHGPLRYVTAYVDGEKVGVEIPFHVIYTGGFSPALWKPVVATDAFDVRSIDFDFSALIPKLWEREVNLELEVSNGLDEFKGTFSGIGSDWPTSANLLAFENEDIVDASGSYNGARADAKGDSLALSLGSNIVQEITAKLWTVSSANISYTFSDGATKDYFVSTNYTTLASNHQLYLNHGTKQSVAVRQTTSKLFDYVLNGKRHFTHTHKPYEFAALVGIDHGPEDIEISVGLATVKKVAVTTEKSHLKVNNLQNGTSLFYIDPKGNHGAGNLTTRYSLAMDGKHRIDYRRRVDVKENTVVHDAEGPAADEPYDIGNPETELSELNDHAVVITDFLKSSGVGGDDQVGTFSSPMAILRDARLGV